MDAETLEHLRRVFLALDYVGVFIFAVTGALVAARARQDFVTCAFFAGMTGMGGGTVRDLLIGAPVFWMAHGWFVAVCLLATAAVWVLRTDQWPGKPRSSQYASCPTPRTRSAASTKPLARGRSSRNASIAPRCTRQALAVRARSIVAQNYTWDFITDQYEALMRAELAGAVSGALH